MTKEELVKIVINWILASSAYLKMKIYFLIL